MWHVIEYGDRMLRVRNEATVEATIDGHDGHRDGTCEVKRLVANSAVGRKLILIDRSMSRG